MLHSHRFLRLASLFRVHRTISTVTDSNSPILYRLSRQQATVRAQREYRITFVLPREGDQLLLPRKYTHHLQLG